MISLRGQGKKNYAKGQGKVETSTGPPRPPSASNKLMITAIVASSLSSLDCGLASIPLFPGIWCPVYPPKVLVKDECRVLRSAPGGPAPKLPPAPPKASFILLSGSPELWGLVLFCIKSADSGLVLLEESSDKLPELPPKKNYKAL